MTAAAVISADSHVQAPPDLATERLDRARGVVLRDDPVALRHLDHTGAAALLWDNDHPHDLPAQPGGDRPRLRRDHGGAEAHDRPRQRRKAPRFRVRTP